jgi:hypothetical protein
MESVYLSTVPGIATELQECSREAIPPVTAAVLRRSKNEI